MYPSISDLIRDLFGFHIPLPIQTFGFFVVIAFVGGAYALSRELRRREDAGWMPPMEERHWVGRPASSNELIWNFLLGFILGYKLLFAVLHWNAFSANPQQTLLSREGNILGGLVLGALLAYSRYRSKKKQQLREPHQEAVQVWPHQRIGDIVMLAVAGGLVGAKIFDGLENWNAYMADPLGSFFSFSGLTYYGGLIVAAVAIIVYARNKQINGWHLVDSAAPALMLAYGLGRLGCQMAGDGDWGIFNSAYVNDGQGGVMPAGGTGFADALRQYGGYFTAHYGSPAQVPHAGFLRPDWLSFLPNWCFAFTYPHNVNAEGVPIPGCSGAHCAMLPLPVFPTPLYEIIMCLLLFVLLWAIRKKIRVPGLLFGIYLILNGLERFSIELIRVNTRYSIFGIHPTQAEIISSLLVLSGIALILYVRKAHPPLVPTRSPAP